MDYWRFFGVKLVALVFLLSSLESASGQCVTHPLTVSDVLRLSTLIRDRIFCYNNATDEDGNRYHPLLAGFIRLAFHSSISKSFGGCVNLDDPRQSRLRLAVEELEQLLVTVRSDSYYAPISRADFWALAGITALEVASKFTRSVNFRYGRCDACTDTYDTVATLDLPDQTFSIHDTYAYFNRTFGFSHVQSIAIMGAHSLGLVTDMGNPATIFGKWIPNPEALTNGFYFDMQDSRLQWQQVPRFFPTLNRTIWSWRHGTDVKRVYLNCDMALYKELNTPDQTNGFSICNYTSCPFAQSYLIVQGFVSNSNLFQAWFENAFKQMIEFAQLSNLKAPV